jgi:hypothetical protein
MVILDPWRSSSACAAHMCARASLASRVATCSLPRSVLSVCSCNTHKRPGCLPSARSFGPPLGHTACFHNCCHSATGILCRSAPPRTRASCQPRHARAATTTNPLRRFHCAHTRIHPHASGQATTSSSRSTCSSRCALQCAGPAPHAIARHAIGPCCRVLHASRG